jgi:hypothetical protein
MGSFRSLGVMAACAVSWTCSVYDGTLLSSQEVTTGGSAVVTAGSAGTTASGGNSATVAGTKSNNGGTTPAVGGNAGTSTDAAGTGSSGSASVDEAGGVGGAGGDSGAVVVTCDGAPIPLKGSWKASASHSSLAAGAEYYNPPEYVMDLSTKRWSTGKPQAGDEWLQIDFGAPAAIRQLSFTLNPDDADDYPRIYQIKISDAPLDFNATIRASGAGALGQTLTVTLAEPVVGRYLLVQQKGKDAESWWSVSELTVTCF